MPLSDHFAPIVENIIGTIAASALIALGLWSFTRWRATSFTEAERELLRQCRARGGRILTNKDGQNVRVGVHLKFTDTDLMIALSKLEARGLVQPGHRGPQQWEYVLTGPGVVAADRILKRHPVPKDA